jgi:hypothetical protein
MKNNMEENFKEFVTRLSDLDNPIGDLCRDMRFDKNINWNGSTDELRKYIQSIPFMYGSHIEEAVKGFLKEFDKKYK